jgi:hypothetical protein
MDWRLSGWCRLFQIGFFCSASVMAGCAVSSPDRTSALKSRSGNVQIGKASYNQSTLGFENPWPFGAVPGPGVNTD